MGLSIWHVMIIIVLVLIPVLVFGPVVKKAGFSRWWSLILILPLINLIMVWAFAFMKWPAEENA